MKHLEKVREVLKELNRLEREYVDGVLLTVVAETALQAHEEEVRELVEAAKLARIALFVATTPLPEDREAVRTAQAKVAAALRPFTEDEK